MSDLKAMIKIEASDASLTAWVWLPPQQAAQCLASVAAAWINRGCAPECLHIGTARTDSGLASPPCAPKAPGSGCCA